MNLELADFVRVFFVRADNNFVSKIFTRQDINRRLLEKHTCCKLTVGATPSTGRRRRGGRVRLMDSVWRGHLGCGGRSYGDTRRSICENEVL